METIQHTLNRIEKKYTDEELQKANEIDDLKKQIEEMKKLINSLQTTTKK